MIVFRLFHQTKISFETSNYSKLVFGQSTIIDGFIHDEDFGFFTYIKSEKKKTKFVLFRQIDTLADLFFM